MPSRIKRAYYWLMFSDDSVNDGYRFFMVINYASIMGLLGRSLFIFIFLSYDITELAMFNALTCILYLNAFYLNRQGHHKAALFIETLEIIAYATLTCLFLGWNSGFHIYILCLVPILFFSLKIKNSMKFLITILLCMIYIILNFYTRGMITIYAITGDQLLLLNYANYFVAFLIVALLAYYYNLAVSRAETDLKKAYKKMEIIAGTDPLTSLLNRRSMAEVIDYQVEICKRTGDNFSVILSDIDNFKIFNDTYGHDCGDFVLVSISRLLKSLLRKEDRIARWGGEEFMVLLTGTKVDDGKKVAEKIRSLIASSTLNHNGQELTVTMTFGLSEYNGTLDAHDIINEADQFLYTGKRRGKNCVVTRDE